MALTTIEELHYLADRIYEAFCNTMTDNAVILSDDDCIKLKRLVDKLQGEVAELGRRGSLKHSSIIK